MPDKNKKFEAVIVFGKEAVNRAASGDDLERGDEVQRYRFKTEMERDAFLKGVEAGTGWIESYPLTEDYEFALLKNVKVKEKK